MRLRKKKKKLKSLVRLFHSAKKPTTTTERGVGVWGAGGGVPGEEKKEKKSKRLYTTSRNIRITNVFLESLLSESFPSLGITVHLTSIGCPLTTRWSLDLVWRQLRF